MNTRYSLFIVCLIATLLGCNRTEFAQNRSKANLPPEHSPTVSPPWQLPPPTDPGNNAADPGVNEGQPRPSTPPQGMAEDDVQPARRPSRTPLIRGLSEFADSVPVEDEQRNELLDSLEEADEIFAGIKDENRRAIADLNRQVQLKSEQHPHIVLILANQLSLGQLSCYQQAALESPVAPSIDRIASEGAVMQQFYAGATEMQSSFWTLLTGHDTSQAKDNLALPTHFLLPEVLWKAGYQTAFVGHWPAPTAGLSRGFDDWFAAPNDQDPHFPEYLVSGSTKIRVPKNKSGAQGQFADELYTEEALSVLRRRDRKRPLFLVVSYTSPAAAKALDVGDIFTQLAGKLDRDIERIDNELVAQKINRSTALFITSHTAPADEDQQLKGALGDLYEGGLRVPMIIRWPLRIRPGRLIDEPFGMWDLMPTFAGMAGAIRVPKGLNGTNAMPFLVERTRRPPPSPLRRLLYWQHQADAGLGQAVRMGDWKVVRPAGRTSREDVELYNLVDDPAETSNVADQFPKILESFLRGR